MNLTNLIKDDYITLPYDNADNDNVNNDNVDNDNVVNGQNLINEQNKLIRRTVLGGPTIQNNIKILPNNNITKELFRRLVHMLIFKTSIDNIKNILTKDIFFSDIYLRDLDDLVDFVIVPWNTFYENKFKNDVPVKRYKIRVCDVIRDDLINNQCTYNDNNIKDYYIYIDDSIADLLAFIDDNSADINKFNKFNESEHFPHTFFENISNIIIKFICTNDLNNTFDIIINDCKEMLKKIDATISDFIIDKRLLDEYSDSDSDSDSDNDSDNDNDYHKYMVE